MAYACVQSRSAASNNTSSAALAYSSSVTAGNTLIVVVAAWNRTPTGISDTRGSTWTLVQSKQEGAGPFLHEYRAYNISGGANTVTVTVSPSEDVTLAIHEYSGLTATDPLDVKTTNSGASGTAHSTGTTASTTQATELVFCCGTNAGATNLPTNFTDTLTQRQNINTATDMPILTGDKRITSTGTQSEAWTWGAAGEAWIAMISTYKEDTGGGGATGPPTGSLALLGVGT